MSQLVATINRKEVYSDKAVDSIVGTRINFEDGSWCDVSSGQVVNKGPGYINIGMPAGASGEKITKGPTTYNAHNIEVRNIVADLDVRVHQGDNIIVSIVGPKNEVEVIRVNQRGDTVVIEGEGQGGGVTIITNRRTAVTRVTSRTISVGGAYISGDLVLGHQVGGNSGENPTRITVKLPKGGAVNLAEVSGVSVIGDTEGKLQANVSDGNVKAGRVSSANLSVKGSGDIDVTEVNGSLNMSIMGSGDIRVYGGKVSALAVSVMGSGDANFHGRAENATLSIMGSGDIRVDHVENHPNTSIMGSGDIRVGNW